VTGPELWRAFANDPRAPENAPMRASDADRDIVLGVLAEAYAEGRLDREEYDERSDAAHIAKTLGELPGLLDDLVPHTAIVPLGSAALASVEEQAVARWEKSRREAFMGFLIPTVICWVIWSATMFGGFAWPLFPMIGTAIPLMGAMVQRKDMIESNRRRILRRQEKELRQQQRKQLPPG
jgi:hypothetical protein